jgi:enamine deaminase RidA (YjgF/YER057c/UK114 family)
LLSKGHRHADQPFHRQKSTDPLAGADAFRSVYSHSAEVQAAGRLLFISGQFGAAPDGKLLGEFAPQCEQAVDNVEALLSAAGMTTVNIGEAAHCRVAGECVRSWEETVIAIYSA